MTTSEEEVSSDEDDVALLEELDEESGGTEEQEQSNINPRIREKNLAFMGTSKGESLNDSCLTATLGSLSSV